LVRGNTMSIVPTDDPRRRIDVHFDDALAARVTSFATTANRTRLIAKSTGPNGLELESIDVEELPQAQIAYRERLRRQTFKPGDPFEVEVKHGMYGLVHCQGAEHPISFAQHEWVAKVMPLVDAIIEDRARGCVIVRGTFKRSLDWGEEIAVESIRAGDRTETVPKDVLYSPHDIASTKDRKGLKATASSCSYTFVKGRLRLGWSDQEYVDVPLSKEQRDDALLHTNDCVTIAFEPTTVEITRRVRVYHGRLVRGRDPILSWQPSRQSAYPLAEWRRRVALTWPKLKGRVLVATPKADDSVRQPDRSATYATPLLRRQATRWIAQGHSVGTSVRADGISDDGAVKTTIVDLLDDGPTHLQDSQSAISPWLTSEDDASGATAGDKRFSFSYWWGNEAAGYGERKYHLGPAARKTLEERALAPTHDWFASPTAVLRHGGWKDGHLAIVIDALEYPVRPKVQKAYVDATQEERAALIAEMHHPMRRKLEAAMRFEHDEGEARASISGLPFYFSVRLETPQDLLLASRFRINRVGNSQRTIFRILDQKSARPRIELLEVTPYQPESEGAQEVRWFETDDGLWGRMVYRGAWPIRAEKVEGFDVTSPTRTRVSFGALKRHSLGFIYAEGAIASP
jgi:hypothetical protein